MTIEKANKNIEKSKNFYRLYIKQAVDLHDNSRLCELLKVDRSYIINTLKRDNTMGLYRLANQIHNAITEPAKRNDTERN